MFLTAAPPALGGGCASGAGQRHCVSSRLAFGQMLLTAALPGPWGRVCFRYGPVALRFVTVGLWPNVPHGSAPALSGGCASGAGQWHCVSLRLACGQMLLKAAPPALSGGCTSGAGHEHCVSSRLACGQMFLKAAPRPLGRVCFRFGPRALRFVTVGLWPNAPQSSAPALGAGVLQVRASGTAFRRGWPAAKCSSQQRPRPLARGSVSKFSTKNTPNVENTRKE